jgi:hypothetical protein
MSPTLAFGLQVWTRHRLGLTLCAGYWLLLPIVAYTLPAKSFPSWLLPFVLIMPCGAVFGYLLAIFSIGLNARLESRESGFPARLWTLPQRTRALVGWPMLWGTLVLMLAWLSLPWGVLRPAGIDITLLIWLPALMLPVTLAWLQALVWSPLPLPGLRLVLVGPVLGAALIGPEILLVNSDIHPSFGYGLLAVQLPLAYLTAIYGVSRARRGDVPSWNWPGWPAWLRWTSATTVGRPFVSPARAQLWFEWRRWGFGLPLWVAGYALLLLPMITWVAQSFETAARGDLQVVPPSLRDEIGDLWLVLAELLFVPAIAASFAGLEIGKLPGRNRTCSTSSFLTTRPVSVALFLRVKFQAAVLSTLATWAVFLLAILIWFALSGRAAEMMASFDALRQRHPPGPFWCSLILFVVVVVVLTWLQMVQGLWMGLARSAWQMALSFINLGGLIAVFAFGGWLANSPRGRQTFADMLPWLAGGVVALKSAAAVCSLRALSHRRILPPRVLWGALAVWLVFAAGLFAALCWLLPSGRTFVSAIVLGIALLLPLTRLALAPLALNWNRHR